MKNMKNLTKRGLALLLTLVMCMGMLPVSVLAEESLTGSDTETVTVTFDANGGKWSDGTTKKDVTVEKGGTVGSSMPENPNPEDRYEYHFESWSTAAGGTGNFAMDTPITSDITMYASWENHLWDDGKITANATCLKDGVKTFTCKECGCTKSEKAGEKLGHDFGDSTWTDNCTSGHEADCTGHTMTCGRDCGETGSIQTEPHRFETVQENEDGTMSSKCACGHTITVTVAGGHTTTYTGKNQSLPESQVSVTATGLKDVTFYIERYEDKDDNTVRSPKDVGEYIAVITLDGGAEIGRVPFTITPAVLIATYAGETVNAGETPKGEVTVTGFVGKETAEGLAAAGDYTAPTVDVSSVSTSTAGTQTLTPSGGAAKNYTFKYVSGTLTVKTADGPEIKGTCNKTTEYNGKEQPLNPRDVTVTIKSGDTEETVPSKQLTITSYKDPEGNPIEGQPKDAGTYTAVVQVKDEDGKVIGTVEVPYIIKPAVLTATYAGETVKAGETPKGVVTVTGFVNGETAATADGYTAPTVGSVDTSTAGTQTLTPAGGAAKNYTFEYVSGTLTVTGSGGGSKPDFKPDPITPPPTEPDPADPTPDPAPVTPEPEPEPEPEPTPRPVLPDPSDPDSPDVVTIIEEDVPRTYVKIWVPENEEYLYVLEEDIPLANTPQTGDASLLWHLTSLLSACGLAFLNLRKKNRS